MQKIRILFVCLGNICRSPMAEAVFMHKVRESGLAEYIEADSAGTGSWHTGDQAHQGTRDVLARNNIVCNHAARTITPGDLVEFDYIITMDEDNLRTVRYLGPAKAKIVRFLDFAPASGVREVPDPWFDGRFDYVYELVDQASEGLLSEIKSKITVTEHSA